jgi:capsular exopolysaccharide synthesis family protein
VVDANSSAGGIRALSLPRAVWRFRWLVILGIVLGALGGLGVAQLQPVRYEATTELLLSDPREAGVFRDLGPARGDATRFIRNQAQRFQSTTVAARASEILDSAVSPAGVRDRIVAQPATDVDIIVLRATARTAEGAATLANAVVQAYEEVVTAEIRESAAAAATELQEARQDLQTRIAAADRLLGATDQDADLQGGLESARIEREALVNELVSIQSLQERLAIDVALYGAGVEVLEPALPPAEAASPRPVANAVLGALLGMLAAIALAVQRAQTSLRVESRHDPAAILGAPLLGDVPDFGRSGKDLAARPTVDDPRSPAAESYRFIAGALDYVLEESQARTILLTSPAPGDGKTTTALNLAVALGRDGQRVALVDADARVAGLTKTLELEGKTGLTDLAVKSWDTRRGTHRFDAGDGTELGVIPIGVERVDATQFFRTSRFRRVLDAVASTHDLVVLDAPPLLAVSETSAAAGGVDGVVLVVARGTPLRTLRDVQDRLQFVGAPLLGYVYNRADPRTATYGGYGYGAGYVEGAEAPKSKSRSDRAERGRSSRTRSAGVGAGAKRDDERRAKRSGWSAGAGTPPARK